MTPDYQLFRWTFNRLLLVAFLIRLVLILYARIHDYLFDVSFTDIDYRVFSDAAHLVAEGKSPFDRPTYRYTPLIAWLLVPNGLFPDFGKLLFCLADIFTGWLLYQLLNDEPSSQSKVSVRKPHNVRTWISIFWLFNPLVAIVSARGSADSLVCASVLLSLYLLASGYWMVSAIVHGLLAIQLKLYPIIYLPSIFLHLAIASGHRNTKSGVVRGLLTKCLRNTNGFIYVMVAVLFFFNSLAIGYQLYGQKFVDEALLYHFARVDIRHNFSPYFLPLYLAMENEDVSHMIGRLAFLPQLGLTAAFALKYHRDLPFCWFLTTFAFVSFNKVCTSQYFLWYVSLVPLICRSVQICETKAIFLIALWFFGQAQWLLPAYLLEFQGINTFLWIWAASLAFLFINVYIICSLISNYHPPSDDWSKKLKAQ